MKLRAIITSCLMLCSLNIFADANTPEAVPSRLHVFNAAGDTFVDHVLDGCTSIRYYIN